MTKIKISIHDRETYIRRIIENTPGISINKIQKRLKGTGYGVRKDTLLDIVSNIRGKWGHSNISQSKFKEGRHKKVQMHMWGEYRNDKTGEKRNMDGWSMAHPTIDKKVMIDECVNECLSKLGGTNWSLIRIYTLKFTLWHKV